MKKGFKQLDGKRKKEEGTKEMERGRQKDGTETGMSRAEQQQQQKQQKQQKQQR